MEVTGSGEVSKKDIWTSVKSNYKHSLNISFQLTVVCSFLIFFTTKYYFDTTFLGEYTVQQLDKDRAGIMLGISFVILVMGFLFVLGFLLIMSFFQFKDRKVSIGTKETVLINSTGITIFSEKLQDRAEYRIGWRSVEDIELKKQYVIVYLTSKSDLNLCIPSRYFSEDNLMEKIYEIQKQER